MKPVRTRMHLQNRRSDLRNAFHSAASLHCHTTYSKEGLTFIPHYAAMIPVISRIFRVEMERYVSLHGSELNFNQAFWTPPLTPKEVIDAESRQIEERLGLKALVSLTDHDDIEAGLQLQVLDRSEALPVSLEWTVPYKDGFFHLGIHNLPAERASMLNREMMKYTRRDNEAMVLRDLLVLLNDSPEILIVFNHPLWDIEFLGAEKHCLYLNEFLAEYGTWIHALEVNGFRSWGENRNVMKMAEELGFPVVTGGDRHGCRSNTVLNLTRAESFTEFVSEIRDEGRSEILFMPEYLESTVVRTMESAADIIRHYPNHPLGRTKWTDRVFINLAPKEEPAQPNPLSQYWINGGPIWVRGSLWLLRMLGSRRLKPALRLALSNERVSYES